jgi:N-acetylneuraminic acid mutarotase
MYVIGGFDGTEYFNSCRVFHLIDRVWNEIAPMNERRCYVSVAYLNGLLYAMGGFNGHVRQNTAEKYLFETNQWSAICPMHVQRSDASACTLNGNIYIPNTIGFFLSSSNICMQIEFIFVVVLMDKNVYKQQNIITQLQINGQ